jgi:extradiol dioxygenase family protein
LILFLQRRSYDRVVPFVPLHSFNRKPTPMKAPTSNPGMLSPFHLAFPVHDLALARKFYGETLGCPEGRSSPEWIDFNFYGHQIVAHLAPDATGTAQRNAVDGHGVPVRHFGIVLPMAEWEAAAERLGRRHRVRHRAVHPLQGRAGRAGHHVLPRSVGQCAGAEGVLGHRDAVREVARREAGGPLVGQRGNADEEGGPRGDDNPSLPTTRCTSG